MNFKTLNEYTLYDSIINRGVYYHILQSNLSANKGFDLVSKFKKISNISESAFNALVSELSDNTDDSIYTKYYSDFTIICSNPEIKNLSDGFIELFKLMSKCRIADDVVNVIDSIHFKQFLTDMIVPYEQMLKQYYHKNKIDVDYDIWLMQNGYSIIFSEYPLLFRLICELLLNTSINIAECIERLSINANDICQTLGIDVSQKIVRIDTSISDRHNNGRSVIIIHFINSSKIVYKPRNMKIDIFWKNLIETYNSLNPKQKLRTIKTLSYDNYGFSEYIEHIPHIDVQQAPQYYYICGTLLGIVSLLGGSDFHHENIIVSNGYPFLIDLETLVSPFARKEYSTCDEIKDTRIISQLSIIRTLFLPQWVGKSPDTAVDISGFFSHNPRKQNYPINNNNGNCSVLLRIPQS